ncbi:MAG: methyltetrahydrofolate cobalamin methyltransferase [Clostridiales bacterium]|jgi:5-methyltetrahydrofolate corrinoid/iron sulfur protein methyltransferase|nr:methyltetrahydrofolate cobalamin methyltransferase [Clostridiales bacterium]
MIIIGEKINGSIPSVGKAIAERDEAFIKDLAIRQSEANANYIDVCASVEGAQEMETMEWLIGLVQSVTDTPICIDSPNSQVCVDCIKFCNKPGLINSVSMEGKKVDIVFPVIADTDWGVIALLCDDSGIPSNVAKRLQVADRIMALAKEYGIANNRVYIDPLVTALSTNEESLSLFVECTKELLEKYPGLHITSGLSNISFGLPARKLINIAFMTLAMNAGMDSAIVDPTNRDMLGNIYATEALLQIDEFCLEYINAFRDGLIGPVKK